MHNAWHIVKEHEKEWVVQYQLQPCVVAVQDGVIWWFGLELMFSRMWHHLLQFFFLIGLINTHICTD